MAPIGNPLRYQKEAEAAIEIVIPAGRAAFKLYRNKK
jgi:hypothetical protein